MERREMVLKGTDNHPHPLTFCISGGNTQCSLCGNDIDEGSWFYFCDECSLRLHLRCGDQLKFPNKNRQEMETREMVSKGIRDNHQHPLTLHTLLRGHCKCRLCCKNIDKGSFYYDCSQCSYSLHLYCGDFLEFVSLSSDLHPLKLLRVVDNITCHYCEKSDQNTLMYTCDNCSIHIHQKCLVIPLPIISLDSKDHSQYMCHDHPMTLVEHDGKCDRVIRHCLACQSPWSSDLAYTCQKSCENVLHKACVVELPQKIERPSYHPHHSLKLQFCEPRQSCSACYKRGGKLMYFCCDQGCNFILGTECAFLAPTMTWNRDDDHFLFLIERAYYGSDQNCYFCHNSYEKQLVKDHNEVIHTQSFLFRCFECDFNTHFLCGPFPSIIKHECHVHSLSLVNYIDDDDDSKDKDSNDYYCDACEKKRNPRRFRVYYCAKCKYVAHIHCVISEVIKILKGDLKNVELLALGDNRWKNTNEEGRKDGEQEEEAGMSIQTLGDLMESLTDAERKQLLNPRGNSTVLKPLHDKAREENSRRYERKDDGEDIHRIQNLFNITSDDIWKSYIHEFWYFNSEEGLKFDERHLKMKVVDVQVYKVPRSLAPVLQTLLRQNGDFCEDSSLRPEMKSIACTFVCILLESMSMTKPEDITKDLLKHWLFYYSSIRTITGLDLDFLTEILWSLVKSFLGSEAIKFKKEMAERLSQQITELPQQITKLQLQLETSKANLEKLKGIGESTASELMKECLRQSSELKRKGWEALF